MNLAFAIVFLWIGAAALHLASHGIQATTPWEAFQTVLSKARGA
jgi:hypothetical protein